MNAQRAISSKPGATIHRRTRIVLMISVLDPFPDITVHVVQAERVGVEGANRQRIFTIEAGMFDIKACTRSEGSACSSPASIFPFGLTRQSIRVSGGLGQPINIGLSIRPTDAGDRMGIVLFETWSIPSEGCLDQPFVVVPIGAVAARLIPIGSGEECSIFLSLDLISAECERLNCELADRQFVLPWLF